MQFRWNEWNIEHVVRHGVDPDDAERAVVRAQQPYPRHRGDGKWLVWADDRAGRPLQVVFVLDDDDAIYVIHARPLTRREKARFKRERKR
jgi:uncharacterized DUF497 family protein